MNPTTLDTITLNTKVVSFNHQPQTLKAKAQNNAKLSTINPSTLDTTPLNMNLIMLNPNP
jgi:hypothetical protein